MKLWMFLFVIGVQHHLFDCFHYIRCPALYLDKGTVSLSKDEGKQVAKFKCNRKYQLVGDDSAVCVHGIWNSTFHVCAKKNYCRKFPKLYHGDIDYMSKMTEAHVTCDTGFTLHRGSSLVFCAENGWNDTTEPSCLAEGAELWKPCHFEMDDPDHCLWLIKSSSYKWVIYPPLDNSHSMLMAAEHPPYDHTLAPHPDGHYLFLLRNSRRRPNLDNTSLKEAYFVSPLFPATYESNETACLVFYYFVTNLSYGGTLKVLVNDDVIWKSENPEEQEWIKQTIQLQDQHKPFRITLVGVGESGLSGGLAVDDLIILKGAECNPGLIADIHLIPETLAETIILTTTPSLSEVSTAVINSSDLDHVSSTSTYIDDQGATKSTTVDDDSSLEFDEGATSLYTENKTTVGETTTSSPVIVTEKKVDIESISISSRLVSETESIRKMKIDFAESTPESVTTIKVNISAPKISKLLFIPLANLTLPSTPITIRPMIHVDNSSTSVEESKECNTVEQIHGLPNTTESITPDISSGENNVQPLLQNTTKVSNEVKLFQEYNFNGNHYETYEYNDEYSNKIHEDTFYDERRHPHVDANKGVKSESVDILPQISKRISQTPILPERNKSMPNYLLYSILTLSILLTLVGSVLIIMKLLKIPREITSRSNECLVTSYSTANTELTDLPTTSYVLSDGLEDANY